LKTFPKYLLLTGLITGTLDGLAAAIMYVVKSGKDPMNVFRFIASGVFGQEALKDGLAMGLMGVLFHYVIALGWTVLFFLLAAALFRLSKSWILLGVLYGILVWLMMNLIIVPLSFVPMKSGPREWTGIVSGMLILIFCVGLPVSFAAHKYLKQKT
jgi:hypothetical protein